LVFKSLTVPEGYRCARYAASPLRHLQPAGLASAGALTIDPAKHSIDGVRNARYCEIVPVVRSGFHLVATVYNTLGLNDCPPAVWDKITEADMKNALAPSKSSSMARAIS
jgi:hypothetical protein